MVIFYVILRVSLKTERTVYECKACSNNIKRKKISIIKFCMRFLLLICLVDCSDTQPQNLQYYWVISTGWSYFSGTFTLILVYIYATAVLNGINYRFFIAYRFFGIWCDTAPKSKPAMYILLWLALPLFHLFITPVFKITSILS